MHQKFIDKAKTELGEDELKKSQALQQFRDYIAKHPYCTNVCTDDIFLLQFLRGKKYRMNKVFKTFDRFIICSRRFSKIAFDGDYDFEKFLKLSTDSFLVQLKDRDAEGRKIFLERVAKRDPEEFDEFDAIKARGFVLTLALFEEETQIAGIVHIIDFSDTSLKHLYSILVVMEFFQLINACMFFRTPTIYLVNLPAFARFILDVVLTIAKEKLRQRIIVLKNSEDLKNFIDPGLLPKEYGGTKNFDEIVEDFSEVYEKYGKYAKPHFDIEIDWSKVSEDEIWNDDKTENVGSFQKLEID